MRTRTVVALCTVLALGLLAPDGAWARRVSASGSLTINLAPPGTLTNQIVVIATLAHAEPGGIGEEADATVEMPLTGGIYTTPYLVNKETTGLVEGDFDTVLSIVNITSLQQFPIITIRRLDGSQLTRFEIIGGLAPGETRTIRLSNILP